MKKRFIFVLSLSALLVYLVVYSCMDESSERQFEKDGEVDEEQLIQNAMRLYYNSTSVIEDGFIEMRSSSNGNSENNGNLAVRPRWAYSSIEQNNTHQAVEVILEMEYAFNTVTPATAEEFKKNKKKEYLQSKTSLIYLTEKKTGVANIFLMTIVPDLSYLVSSKFDPFKKMSYLKRDNKFEGMVYYHNMKGEFVNGWVYKEGKVVASMEVLSKKSDFQLRSGGCTTYFTVTIVEQCWHTGYYESGVLVTTHSDCYSYYEDYHEYTVCNNSGSNGEYNGGYTGVEDPNDPTSPNNPCISGAAGNSKNNAMLANSKIANGMDKILKDNLKTDPNEWGVVIGRNSSGEYYVSPPQNLGLTGGPISVNLPPGYTWISDGHNHGKNGIGVPSARDIYEFLELVSTNTSIESTFSYGVGWGNAIETYSMNVNDREAVNTFLSKYPRNSNLGYVDFINELFDKYDEVIQAYNTGNYNYNYGEGVYQYRSAALALSYIMSYFNMGISLSRRVDNGYFEIINTQKVQKSFNITTCQ